MVLEIRSNKVIMARNRTWIALIKERLSLKHEIHIYSFADQNYLLIQRTWRTIHFSTKEFRPVVTRISGMPEDFWTASVV
jgi:hypothetical protein